MPKRFSVGFKAKYLGDHKPGAFGGFIEPELYGIGIVYTPELAEGHWSVPVAAETAASYEEKFSNAAERIKNEGRLISSPN